MLRQHKETFVSAKAQVKLDCDLASTSVSLYVGLADRSMSFRGSVLGSPLPKNFCSRSLSKAFVVLSQC